MSRVQHILSRLPDCDDALRRLTDAQLVPLSCRRRGCRRERRCQGGYGPPCYFERREFFSDAVRERMHEYRDHWAEQRQGIEAVMRRLPPSGPGAGRAGGAGVSG